MLMQVYQGICKTNDEKVAIKKLDLDDIAWGVHWVCSPRLCMICKLPAVTSPSSDRAPHS